MASQANKDPNAPVQRKDSAEGEARRRAAGYTDDGDRLQEVGGDVTEQEAALIVMEFCRKSVLGMQEMIRQYGKMARFFVCVHHSPVPPTTTTAHPPRPPLLHTGTSSSSFRSWPCRTSLAAGR